MFRKAMVTVLTICIMATSFALLFACSGCSSDAEMFCVEAEVMPIDGEKGNDARTFIASANSGSENETSGSRYATNLNVVGNVIYFAFTADTAGSADLYLSVANAVKDAESFDVSKIVSIKLNDTSIDVPATQVGVGSAYTDAWVPVIFSGASLKAGCNVVAVTITSVANSINIDYLGVDTATKSDVADHTFSWKTETVPATCTETGAVYRSCEVSGIRYLYSVISATGHSYGDWYINEDGVRYRVCSVCGHIEYDYDWAPDEKYVSQVFDSLETIEARPATGEVKTTYEAEYAFVDYSGGLSNGSSYIEITPESAGASNGKIVANISNVGNEIEFKVNAEKATTASLVVRASNVLWTSGGIADLNPLSDYISFEINGDAVNQDLVSFAGNNDWNWYLWRYILIENVELKEGENSILMYPEEAPDGTVTIPNTDTMYIYTDEDVVTPRLNYSQVVATKETGYVSNYKNEFALEQLSNSFALSTTKDSEADIVVEVEVTESAITNMAKEFVFEWNNSVVDTTGITSLAVGIHQIVIKAQDIKAGNLEASFMTASNVEVKAVTVYTKEDIQAAYKDTTVDASYDFMKDGKEASYVYDVTYADRGGKGVINQNGSAYNNTLLEYFGTGDTLVFEVVSEKSTTADIALRAAWAEGGSLDGVFTISINGKAAIFGDAVGSTGWSDLVMSVVKDVALEAGVNTIVVSALQGVNTDCLAVYSDDSSDIFDIVYDIENAVINNSFVGGEFSLGYNLNEKSESYVVSSTGATTQNLAISFKATSDIEKLASEMTVMLNGKTVKLALNVTAGENIIVITGVAVVSGINTVSIIASEVVEVSGVVGYTATSVNASFVGVVDNTYDAFTNEEAKTPIFTFEAEDATLTGEFSGESGGSLSGGAGIGGGNKNGNVVTYDFTASVVGTGDIALRVACANWDGSGNADINILGESLKLTINGELVDLSNVSLEAGGQEVWDNYVTVVIKGVDIAEGSNVVEMSYVSGGFVNIDCMYVYSTTPDLSLAITPSEAE